MYYKNKLLAKYWFIKIVKKDNIISDIINVINILICSLSHVLEKIKAATVDRVHKFTGKQRKSKETYNPNAHSLRRKTQENTQGIHATASEQAKDWKGCLLAELRTIVSVFSWILQRIVINFHDILFTKIPVMLRP